MDTHRDIACLFHTPVASAIVLVVCALAAAQPPDRPFREAFVVETDSTAEKRLTAVAEHVDQQHWDAAIALLREVSTSRPDAVVRVSPQQSLAVPRYCDLLLTRFPPAGLAAYRRSVDPQAAAWLAEADANHDERPLRMIVERAFASSSGDDALARLAERAWERGEFDRARHYWTLLVPLDVAPREKPPAVLRYPETDIDLAAIRARLILCSIALGEHRRAARELAAFQQLHPEIVGRLAGREGRLATLLGEELEAAIAPSGARAGHGWDLLPPIPETRTLGATAHRSGTITVETDVAAPLFFRPLPPSPYATEGSRPALPDLGPLAYYPVVWRNKVFVADADRVFGFDLTTGDAAWPLDDNDPGILYPPVAELEPAFDGTRSFLAGPLLGVPRHTLTVHRDRLYARLGPPVTSWPARELRRISSSIVCLDLAHQGLLAWSLSSNNLGEVDESWAFEGPPVADGERLYVLANRSRPQAQLNLLCLDAATGAIHWNRAVGAPITSPPEAAAVMTHRLVTVSAGRVFLQTNHGAVLCLDAAEGRPLWVGWYESRLPRDGAGNASERGFPAACLVSGGVIVAAPSDSDHLLAYDAASGVELWRRPVQSERELLGARDGIVVVSGRRLRGLDLFTGRELWSLGFSDPPGYGAGRGVIADRIVYWPTREDLLVADVESGELIQRVPLKSLYGLSGGGNLAANAQRLLIARPDGLVGFGSR